MPSVSKAQQAVMAIAEHHPGQLFARNRGVLKLSGSQLHEFAATKRSALPARVSHPHANLGKYLQSKKTSIADHVTALRSKGAFRPAPRGART